MSQPVYFSKLISNNSPLISTQVSRSPFLLLEQLMLFFSLKISCCYFCFGSHKFPQVLPLPLSCPIQVYHILPYYNSHIYSKHPHSPAGYLKSILLFYKNHIITYLHIRHYFSVCPEDSKYFWRPSDRSSEVYFRRIK